MVAFADRSLGFEPMKPHRTLMHDVFSFAVTLGGVVIMLASNVQGKDAQEVVVYYTDAESGEINFRRSATAWVAIWLLVVVM
jgi:ABC-type molybdate transport system permease subunit